MRLTVILAALCAALFATQATACDAMRPCYANGKFIFSTSFEVAKMNTTRHRRMSPDLARVMAEGAGRIVAHPAGCPRVAFCACGALKRLAEVWGVTFKNPRSLWLAANWFRFPRTSPAPGTVAVKRHHVFVLERHIGGSTWIVYDANSGGRRTRVHPRSIAGYVIVQPTGGA